MKFAILFPGQGSQQPGMGKFLSENFKIARETFEEASDAISFDLKKLCFDGSPEDLALTENTQPALLTVSTATERVLRAQFGLQGSVTAGHSIGEYGSLVAANSIHFKEAIKAVRTRGQAMQSAVPVGLGGMIAALGLTDLEAQELCGFVAKKPELGPLTPANFNSPGQIVLSGSQRAIEYLRNEVKPEMVWSANPPRLKLIPLQVSAPFHSPMMKPAEDKMRKVLSDIPFQDANIPVIQNLTAKVHQKSSELRENLIQQVSAPVRWTQSMETLKQMGVNHVVELGAGKVLQGLLKKIDSEFFRVLNTNNLEDLENIGKLAKN